MGKLSIERVGGFASFGGASRLESRGEQDLSALSAADRATVDKLFREPDAVPGEGLVRDGFRYRITRTGQDGRAETVEVPEAAVPRALRATVVDRIK